MRFARISVKGRMALCVRSGEGGLVGRFQDDPHCPGNLKSVVAQGSAAIAAAAEALAAGRSFDPAEVVFLPPIHNAEKIICVGLNYAEHATETGNAAAPYPAIFSRFNSSLIGHQAVGIVPRVSSAFDYEGELAVVIGKSGRAIPRADALDHVAGYALFNDMSVRDYQMKSSQWTVGKNFDGTGAFGPDLVTADELPPGARGLKLETRLNGEIVQSANTDDMICDVAMLVEILSTAMTLVPGDIIVSGTPSGVGMARMPPLWMKPGDVCEVAIDQIGTLRTPIAAEE